MYVLKKFRPCPVAFRATLKYFLIPALGAFRQGLSTQNLFYILDTKDYGMIYPMINGFYQIAGHVYLNPALGFFFTHLGFLYILNVCPEALMPRAF